MPAPKPARASSVFTKIGSVLHVTRPSAVAIRTLHFPPTGDPAKLALLLHFLQQRVNEVLNILRANPFAVVSVVRDETFSAGQQKAVPHRLQRVPLGFWVIDAKTAAWSGFRTPQTAIGQNGMSTDATSLLLTSVSAGTYSFVFA